MLLSLIMRTCLEKCRDLGLRMAEPGEFTRRAFMNGRMDLTQAEAVADLIDAVSESAVQAAGRSLSGEFSNAVRDVDGNITELRAFIEPRSTSQKRTSTSSVRKRSARALFRPKRASAPFWRTLVRGRCCVKA